MARPIATAIRPRSWSSGTAEATGDTPALPREADATEIQRRLEHHVVGQRQALRELSLLLAIHSRRLDGVRAPNAIVLGPTGVGKTHSLGVAARALALPFVTVDATSLVPAGIVGEQVDDVLASLVRAAGGVLDASLASRHRGDDVALAEHGIILIDEFDKLAAPVAVDGSSSVERRAIQRRLLKLAEGSRMRVGVRRHDDSYRERYIDTTSILLILSGAFPTLTEHRPRRWQRNPSSAGDIAPTDIVDAGFMPELVGRFPVTIGFGPLAPTDLVSILDHPEVSPLGIWRRYFERTFGVQVLVETAAKWAVAERAARLGLGARVLQHLLFPVLAARASAAAAAAVPQDVVLHASDFLAETVIPPGASEVQ